MDFDIFIDKLRSRNNLAYGQFIRVTVNREEFLKLRGRTRFPVIPSNTKKREQDFKREQTEMKDSIIFIHQLMHLYIYHKSTKTLCSFDSSYMFRHTARHHQGAPLSWLKSLVKNIRS
jgi:hypothetical protein